MVKLNIKSEEIKRIAEKFGARFIVLHGSYADGKAHDKSDIDVAVLLRSKRVNQLPLNEYAQLLEELARACDSGMSVIDLSCLKNANILLRYEITSKGQLLYGDPDAYEQFCAFSFRDYIDAKDLFELEDSMIRKRQNSIAHYATP